MTLPALSPDDIPPSALAAMYRVDEKATVECAMRLVWHPLMFESALRGYEAGSFALNKTQVEDFRRALTRISDSASNRFEAALDRVFEDYARTPLERALRAIRERNKEFLTRALSTMGDLSQMLDRQNLPPGTRLDSELCSGLKGAKSVQVSQSAALILTSSIGRADGYIEMSVVLQEKQDWHGPAVIAEGSEGQERRYTLADLGLRSVRPSLFVSAASQHGLSTSELEQVFAKALNRRIRTKAASVQKAGQADVKTLSKLKTCILTLSGDAIAPSVEALSMPVKVLWKDSGNGVPLAFEGPIGLCMPNVKDVFASADPEPFSIWSILAGAGHWQTLENAQLQGADIHFANPFNGATPLHMAAWQRSVECAVQLIRLGADPLDKDVLGRTAADWWRGTSDETVEQFNAAMQSALALRAIDGLLGDRHVRSATPSSKAQ